MKKLLKNKKKFFCYLSIFLIIFFLLFYFATSYIIGEEVKKLCLEARNSYQGDCVEALISQLNDEKQTFRKRNQAIWALGQLGDKKALPVLEKYYTGNIPDKESLDKTISQYELKKAINLAKGGLNITRWVWKYLDK